MARKTKDALRLAAPLGEPRCRPLQPGEALPRRLAQLANDLDCRYFHRAKVAPQANPVKCADTPASSKAPPNARAAPTDTKTGISAAPRGPPAAVSACSESPRALNHDSGTADPWPARRNGQGGETRAPSGPRPRFLPWPPRQEADRVAATCNRQTLSVRPLAVGVQDEPDGQDTEEIEPKAPFLPTSPGFHPADPVHPVVRLLRLQKRRCRWGCPDIALSEPARTRFRGGNPTLDTPRPLRHL